MLSGNVLNKHVKLMSINLTRLLLLSYVGHKEALYVSLTESVGQKICVYFIARTCKR
jgi:hypothetical protein